MGTLMVLYIILGTFAQRSGPTMRQAPRRGAQGTPAHTHAPPRLCFPLFVVLFFSATVLWSVSRACLGKPSSFLHIAFHSMKPP
eukprot:COSAG02_NODE_67806_length_252_cov_0.666667_1_plen_83_part_11